MSEANKSALLTIEKLSARLGCDVTTLSREAEREAA